MEEPAERSKSDGHGRLTLLKFIICHWHDSSKAAPCNTWVSIIRSSNKVYFKIGKMIQCFYTRNRMPFFGKTKVSEVVWILSSFHKLTFPIGYKWKTRRYAFCPVGVVNVFQFAPRRVKTVKRKEHSPLLYFAPKKKIITRKQNACWALAQFLYHLGKSGAVLRLEYKRMRSGAEYKITFNSCIFHRKLWLNWVYLMGFSICRKSRVFDAL